MLLHEFAFFVFQKLYKQRDSIVKD